MSGGKSAINLSEYRSSLVLSPLSKHILKLRYLQKNNDDELLESPLQLFSRVAYNIAQADKLYQKDNWSNDVQIAEKSFFEHMIQFHFVPASPILMYAGTPLQSLFSDHALDVPDSMEDIFEVLKLAASIQQHGGGVGFSFSKIRPHHDDVQGMKNIAFGPLNVMNIFDTTFSSIIQGGRRAGANMSILSVSHPDIEQFITIKDDLTKMTNFNFSVAITDTFMSAVKNDGDFDLVNPRNGNVVRNVRAKELFESIATHAWMTGDPGIIFIDEMQRHYPYSKQKILCTGACGQYELENFEGVPYAHINISRMVTTKNGKLALDEELLTRTVHAAVHFLDNCIDMHKYLHPDIEKKTKESRKIGLGVMGFADLLFALEIPYGSSDSLDVIRDFMTIIRREARVKSTELAKKRGSFPRHKESNWTEPMRNATITSIAPTGTTSLIAHASQSIEPVYALSFTNKTAQGEEFTVLNKAFKEAIDGLSIDRTAKVQLEFVDSIQKIEWLEDDFKKIFKTAMDITPLEHLQVMAVFQKYVDNSISKTINLPNEASVQDVVDIMLKAYELKCKGLTIYRDGSRGDQVLSSSMQTRLSSYLEKEA